MRSRSDLLTILLACASLALVGGCSCGDDDGSEDIDSGPDDFDAPPPVEFSGQIQFVDLTILDHPETGNGPFLLINFEANATTVPPAWEEAPGSPFGCKVYDYTAAEFLDPHLDEGTVQITTPDGYAPMPPCNFVPGVGWACIGAMGGGGDIGIVNEEMGIFSLTDDTATFGADQIGRILHVMGSANPSNNGDFPIVDAAGDSTILYQNLIPGAAVEDATAATYITLAGLGPAGHTFPIEDDAMIGFALTPGGDEDVESFDRMLDMADEFTLTTDSLAVMNAIPTDGSEVTVACQGEGGDCGSSLSSTFLLLTTDASIEGLPPYVLPPPVEKAVLVTCTVLAGSATLPAAGSEFIMNSGATRIRSTFVRGNAVSPIVPNIALTLVAGRGIVGFTDP